MFFTENENNAYLQARSLYICINKLYNTNQHYATVLLSHTVSYRPIPSITELSIPSNLSTRPRLYFSSQRNTQAL
jgi:hypothetical protein